MNKSRPDQLLTRPHIFTVAFFASFLFLLYQLLRLLAPFSAALLWAGIIAGGLYPLHRKTVALLGGRSSLAASLMTLVALIIIVGPAVLLLSALASQTVEIYQWAVHGAASGEAVDLWNRITSAVSTTILNQPFLSGLDMKTILTTRLQELSAGIASQVGTILRDALLLVVNIFIMLVALFFFFRDGERYYQGTMDLIPFSEEQKRGITRKLHDTFRAVINGVFLIALVQGLMTGVGFALFSLPFPVFWGFVAAVAALLPLGGAALIWVPAVLYLFAVHAAAKAILLALWGTFLVSLPDNFLKPMLIGRKAKLPAFFLFIGILGGLSVYGILGILFGPLIVTLLTAFIGIYREEFTGQKNGA